jgi:hypothetical protein
MNDKYGVYIIESLRSEDYFDGETLKDILELSKIDAKYEWVESKEEFKNKLSDFFESKYRYLHISCHADYQGLELSNCVISNKEFGEMIKGKIQNRRIFLSACKGGNRNLASIAIKNGAYSLIGSPINLHFDKAVLFWSSFFHVINEFDDRTMKKKEIKEVLKSCSDLFYIPINYYAYIENQRNVKMRRIKIRPDKKSDNRIINIR